MEFNQKFDTASILALQDGKFDNVFLLSLSPWLVDLGKQYHVWDSWLSHCIPLENYRLENTSTNVEIFQGDNLSHNSKHKGRAQR